MNSCTSLSSDFEIINPGDIENWNELLLPVCASTIFHTSNWSKVLQESYDYKPLYLSSIVSDRLEALVPLMEVNSFLTGKRGVSLPFSDFVQPIYNDKNSLNNIFITLKKIGEYRNWNYMELRGCGDLIANRPSEIYVNHTIDLSQNIYNLFNRLSRSTKQFIEKARQNNVEIFFGSSRDTLMNFYELNCRTRKAHGLPPQPLGFFERVFENIIEKKLGVIAFSKYRKRFVSSIICFFFNNNVILKYMGWDRNYKLSRANDLLIWHLIEYFSVNGFRNLSFGRTGLEDSGVIYFKNRWGAEQTYSAYMRYDFAKKAFVKNQFKVSKFQHYLFKSSPLGLLKFYGDILYRHVG